jgi:hypothetical protein
MDSRSREEPTDFVSMNVSNWVCDVWQHVHLKHGEKLESDFVARIGGVQARFGLYADEGFEMVVHAGEARIMF